MATTSEPSQLCSTCSTTGPWGRAGWRDFHTRETYRTHLKWQREDATLLRSVSYDVGVEQFHADAEHCAWCAALRDSAGLPPSVEVAHEEGGFTEYSISLEFCAPEAVRPVRINLARVLVIASREGGFAPFWARFGVFAGPGSVACRVFLSPRETSYQNSEFNNELARQWVENTAPRPTSIITKNHSESAGSPETDDEGLTSSLPLLPTRILEITPNPADPATPAIVLREALPKERGEYICLSYTWGPRRHNFPQLARSLLHEDESAQSPPPPAFPAVFTDAAHVALKLGIRHLWIDALCIWQDDPDDLKAELGQMHRYYSEATVVVQTSGTTSVDESFLGEARNSTVGRLLSRAILGDDEGGQGAGGSGDDEDVEGVFIKIPYFHEHHTNENEDQQWRGIPAETLPSEHADTAAALSSKAREQDQAEIIYLIPSNRLPPLYDPKAEPSASRGWIFQEQNLCRRLLVFPSGGGMLFTTNDPSSSSHATTSVRNKIFHDGQVNHYIPASHGNGGRSRRPAGLPVWGKETLMEPKTGFPEGVTYIPFNDRMLVQIEFMRRLAVLGNMPEMVLDGQGSVCLTLDLRPEEREKRAEGWNEERKKRRAERQRRLAGREELGDGDGGSACVASKDEEKEDGVDQVDQQLARVGLSDDEDAATRADEEHPEPDHGEPLVTSRSDVATNRERKDEPPLPDDSSDEESTHLTRLEPIAITTTMQYPSGTSSTISVPPTEHPLLRMSSGPRSLIVATGPWSGSVFPSHIPEIWHRLVNEYCARKLTNPRDKLIAMAALASAFQAHYGKEVLGEYHAGVWEKLVGEGMLWFAAWKGKEERSSRKRLAILSGEKSQGNPEERDISVVDYDDRAPSWSWASASRAHYPDPKSEIENGVDYMPLDLTVLSVNTSPAENSPAFGSVVGGSVGVRGLVMNVWWGMDVNARGEEVVNLFTAEEGGERVGRYGNASPDHAWLYPDEDGRREEVVLLLGRRFMQGVGHNNDHEAECLLLRERTGQDGEYVRIGFANPVFFSFEKEWRAKFREMEMIIL